MSSGLVSAVEAKAIEMFGMDDRSASAVCYVLWVMQVKPPFNEDYFLLRVKNCQRARLEDRTYNKAVGDLVTYAINFNGRS